MGSYIETYMKLEERDIELIKEITERTFTDYGLKGEFISIDGLWSIIEDLMSEVEKLEEKYEDLENDLESNYRPLTIAEQVD